LRRGRSDTLPLIAQPSAARVLTHGLRPDEHARVPDLLVCSEIVALAPLETADVCAEIGRFEPDLVLVGAADETGLVVLRQLKLLADTHFIPVVVVAPAAMRRAAYTAGADHVTEALDDDLAARALALVRSAVVARAVFSSRQELRLRRDWMRYLVHDLRNLLTKALGHLAHAGRHELEAEVAGHLVACEEELWRGSALLSDLLDIDRIRKGSLNLRRAPTDLALLARRAALSYGEAATRARIAIVVDAPAPAVAFIDAPLIERVIANLLANALRFAPAETAIEIEVGASPGAAFVAVENHGPSIPEERTGRIFEPFVTDAGDGGDAGTGLGLAFCRLVAEVHDGTIAVAEPEGGGARFTMTLPGSS
jgi:two-component system sensor histidine kinase KdpD